ncbi:hypothetical protein Vafri_11306, partial [Volvox africanus]
RSRRSRGCSSTVGSGSAAAPWAVAPTTTSLLRSHDAKTGPMDEICDVAITPAAVTIPAAPSLSFVALSSSTSLCLCSSLHFSSFSVICVRPSPFPTCPILLSMSPS